MAVISTEPPFLGTNFLEKDNVTKVSRRSVLAFQVSETMLTLGAFAIQASLWWGESLMFTYWCIVSSETHAIGNNQAFQGLPYIIKGMLYYVPRHQHHISSLDFFKVSNYRFIGGSQFAPSWTGPWSYDHSGNTSQLAETEAYPNIWKSADALAKSAYSTILIDLGQSNERPNILTDANLLQDYTKLFENFQDKYGVNITANPGPATESYDKLKDATGPLDTTRSVVSTSYLCSVPKRKSTSNLIVSILVADAVFTQVTWRLFTWIIGMFFLRRDSTARYCEGCLHRKQTDPDSDNYQMARQPLDASKGLVYSRVRPSMRDSVSELSNRRNSEDGDYSTETLQVHNEQ